MKIQFYLCWLTLLILSSCANDKLLPLSDTDCDDTSIIVTYDNQIKSIIDLNCATADCHDGSGSAPGDYGSYAGMSTTINSGAIETRVITDRNMPPLSSSITLDIADLKLIQCWIDGDYLEN
jgi:hypothetical protein